MEIEIVENIKAKERHFVARLNKWRVEHLRKYPMYRVLERKFRVAFITFLIILVSNLSGFTSIPTWDILFDVLIVSSITALDKFKNELLRALREEGLFSLFKKE